MTDAPAVDTHADTSPHEAPRNGRHGPAVPDEAVAASDRPGEADADGQPEEPGAPLRAIRGESIGAAVGSFMGGIEQQVFQRRPPAVELVRQATPVRGTSGTGHQVTIDVPPLPDQDR